MPITFECGCGNTLRVKDEYAGRRARCPTCQAVVDVPAAEPVFEVVEDAPPPPAYPPPPSRPARADEEDDGDTTGYRFKGGDDDRPRPRRESYEDEPRPRRRKKAATRGRAAAEPGGAWFQTKRVMFIGLGLFILLGAAFTLFGANDGKFRMFGRAVFGLCVGGGLIIRGLTGDFEDH